MWSVVLYGCETWTLLQDEINRLQVLGCGYGEDCKKISWKEKIRNDEILAMVNEERCPIRTITQRKKNWIGHVLRGNELLRDMMKGRMMGKKRAGKPREEMSSDLKKRDK